MVFVAEPERGPIAGPLAGSAVPIRAAFVAVRAAASVVELRADSVVELRADPTVAVVDFMVAEAAAPTAVVVTGNSFAAQHLKACSSERAFVFLLAPRGLNRLSRKIPSGQRHRH
jgi:hypothetical protein